MRFKIFKTKYPVLRLIIVFIFGGFCSSATGQSKRYKVGGIEQIFSFSKSSNPLIKTAPRLSSIVNIQMQLHYGFGPRLGLYSGVAIRNIGMVFSRNEINTPTRYKLRTYTIGVPLAFKFGNITNKSFVFSGGEIEFPFAFKSKDITNRRKEIYHDWFSNFTSAWLPSLFAGFQIRGLMAITFKYYLTNTFLLPPTLNSPSLDEHRVFYISITKLFPGQRKSSIQSQRPLLVKL